MTVATADRRGRFLGKLLIGALWLLAGYLVLYHSALSYFGWERLYDALGPRLYRLLIPGGGLSLVVYVAVVLLLWSLPIVLFTLLISGVVSRVRPALQGRSRWILASTLALATTLGLHRASFDGWPWMIAPLLGDDTVFAKGYSGREFWHVREGMTAPEVLARIGAPATRMTSGPVWHLEDGWLGAGEEFWTWSHSAHGGNFRLRALHFRDGRVVAKVATFHLD